MTSLPWVAYSQTIATLRDMANGDVFTQKGEDTLAPVLPSAVVGRFSRNQQMDIRERGINLPGLVVTYLGWNNSLQQGSLHQDDGVIRLSVQLVDSGSIDDDTGAESYMCWMNDIREELQTNPFTLDDDTLGQIYLVHVDDQTPPDPEQWAMLQEMRSFINVNCFTRSRRNNTQQPWAVS